MNPFSDISGQRILVTGASSGIGRETCVLLSHLGAQLVLVGRSEDRLAATLDSLDGTGHVVKPKDMADPDVIPAWMKILAKESGPLTGLVHCAGIHAFNPVRFLKDQDFSNMMNVNVNSAVQLAKGFRQKGVRGESNSLVLLASVAGLVGQAGVAAYSASKGAITSLTRSLAMELAAENVRVNCVAPGIVKTEMTQEFQSKLTDEQYQQLCNDYPLGLGEPRDVANAIVFLLSNTSRWVTGTTLVVDGGFTAK